MKTNLTNLLLLSAVLIITTAMQPKEKDEIVGNYRLVKAITNGRPNNAMVMNRTMSFNSNKTFTGKIVGQNGEMPFNQGLYFVENDSMLIMHQSSPTWILHSIAYVYKYRITGDTLNIKGYYTIGMMGNPDALQKFYIDESWVKMGKN